MRLDIWYRSSRISLLGKKTACGYIACAIANITGLHEAFCPAHACFRHVNYCFLLLII
jgi:hypothetical protein